MSGADALELALELRAIWDFALEVNRSDKEVDQEVARVLQARTGQSSVADRLEAVRAADEAARLERQATAIRHEPTEGSMSGGDTEARTLAESWRNAGWSDQRFDEFQKELQAYGDERARKARAAAIEEAARVIDLYDKPLYARPTLVALIRALAAKPGS